MFQIYTDSSGEWRWKFIAANGKTIAASSEGYKDRRDCLNGIRLIKESADADVFARFEEESE